MPTIKEIAKICNVSVATISNIMNDKGGVSAETKKRVMKVIKEMDYTPNHVAKNLKTKNTRSIGVIAEDMTVFAMPDIIDGITEYCEEEDYQILLINLRFFKKYADSYYHNNDRKDIVHKEIRKLLSKQVEGIIYIAAHERLIDMIPDDLPIPTVIAYGFTNKKGIPSVIANDVNGAEELVKYLIANGHRKIGVIAGKKESIHTQARLEGYQKALFAENILYDPTLVEYGQWERESGYQVADKLIEKGVTAIFAMSDFMAGGAYDRIDEMGLEVGKDISVVGYDNREMASYEKPALTTMGLPLHDIGYYSSKVILQLLRKEDIENGDERGLHYIQCVPFFRDSVHKIKGEDDAN